MWAVFIKEIMAKNETAYTGTARPETIFGGVSKIETTHTGTSDNETSYIDIFDGDILYDMESMPYDMGLVNYDGKTSMAKFKDAYTGSAKPETSYA